MALYCAIGNPARATLLGHATISITLDTYSHVIPGLGDAAASAMDDALDDDEGEE